MPISFFDRNKSLAQSAIAAIAILATPVSASAQTELRTTFSALDVNADGVITLEEYRQTKRPEANGRQGEWPEACIGDKFDAFLQFEGWFGDAFLELDANDDGSVSFDEMQAAYTQDLSYAFVESDANHDGFVSHEEFDRNFVYEELDMLAVMSENCVKALCSYESNESADAGHVVAEPKSHTEADGSDANELDPNGVESAKHDLFATIDANGDNRISYDEFIKF